MHDRLSQQLAFLMEIDKLKQILRQTILLDKSRQENDAGDTFAYDDQGMLSKADREQQAARQRAIVGPDRYRYQFRCFRSICLQQGTGQPVSGLNETIQGGLVAYPMGYLSRRNRPKTGHFRCCSLPERRSFKVFAPSARMLCKYLERTSARRWKWPE